MRQGSLPNWCLVIAPVVVLLGCGGESTPTSASVAAPTPTPTPAPTATPTPPANYDGLWSAVCTPTDACAFAFGVSGNAVDSISYRYSGGGGRCNFILENGLHSVTPTTPISGGSLTLRINETVTTNFGPMGLTSTITGTFTSSSRASGQITFNLYAGLPGCSTATGSASWTATKG